VTSLNARHADSKYFDFYFFFFINVLFFRKQNGISVPIACVKTIFGIVQI